jgi:hypothetical protein
MHDIANQIPKRNNLARIRRQAKRRGFRVLRDGTGNFTVISTAIEPPRPLVGLDHVPLWVIEQVVLTPLPEPPPRRRMARLAEPTNAEAPTEAGHPFRSLVEALKAAGGVS